MIAIYFYWKTIFFSKFPFCLIGGKCFQDKYKRQVLQIYQPNLFLIADTKINGGFFSLFTTKNTIFVRNLRRIAFFVIE